MADEHGHRKAPAIIELDDLEHSRHSHEFVGAEHGDVPFSIILVHSEPGVGPKLHRHPYAEVFVVESGQATFQLGDETIVVDGEPGPRLRNPGDAHSMFGAGAEESAQVGEVVVDGVPLDAGSLGYRADRRLRRPDRRVQLKGGLGDPLAHRVEALSPASHPVRPLGCRFLLLSHVHRKY